MDIYFVGQHFIRQVHSHKAPLQTHPSYYPTAELSRSRNTNKSQPYGLTTDIGNILSAPECKARNTLIKTTDKDNKDHQHHT